MIKQTQLNIYLAETPWSLQGIKECFRVFYNLQFLLALHSSLEKAS